MLIRDNLIIIIDDSAITFYQSPKDISRKIGVNPENIPTYLTLTKNSPFQLTKLQAVRLIELYGTLENIYENATKIASKPWEKLSLNKEAIFEEYRKNKIKINNKIKYYNIKKILLIITIIIL